ncbi:MAG: PAQR family membrane homeostasis protein TrhA [Gammaproteobacteria bacterium]
MTPIYSIPGFSEPFSSLSHLIAAGVFAILGGYRLYRERGSRSRVISLSVFVFSGVLLLTASGIFHLLQPGGLGREVFRRIDHAAIFIFIAGTFTPIHGLLFDGWRRWGVLLMIWGFAVLALTLKLVFFSEMAEWLSLTLYLGMGWMGTISAGLLYQRYGTRFHKYLIAGALAYTAGALLDYFKSPGLIPGVIGPHEIFHLSVLLGMGFHWLLVHQLAQAHRKELHRANTLLYRA